jgi:hypothetical protein
VIFSHAIWDDGELFVCGSFWPGAYDGAPPPDWLENGGAPTRDDRTGEARQRVRGVRVIELPDEDDEP